MDTRLAKAYGTEKTLLFLSSYWSANEPPPMHKTAQSILPYTALQYAPALLTGSTGVAAGQGLINRWLSRLLGQGPLSQLGLGLLEQYWAKPIRPSLSLPQLSPRNMVGSNVFFDELNRLRMSSGQAPLPIGSMATG